MGQGRRVGGVGGGDGGGGDWGRVGWWWVVVAAVGGGGGGGGEADGSGWMGRWMGGAWCGCGVGAVCRLSAFAARLKKETYMSPKCPRETTASQPWLALSVN